MTIEQNITAILETYFCGFRSELIEACAKRIMEQIERQADISQTDCETCKYGQDKHRYAHICNECGVGINNYTPQTDCTGSPIGDYRDGVGAWQTDCGWGKPTTVSHREDKED